MRTCSYQLQTTRTPGTLPEPPSCSEGQPWTLLQYSLVETHLGRRHAGLTAHPWRCSWRPAARCGGSAAAARPSGTTAELVHTCRGVHGCQQPEVGVTRQRRRVAAFRQGDGRVRCLCQRRYPLQRLRRRQVHLRILFSAIRWWSFCRALVENLPTELTLAASAC